ncbi:aldo-keto reductase family 1 member B1-like [Haliotis cracherodii]|uniref:aldo-keto reductase family 1 member B1-like n=1 Tax=Haliotis cracherodii TaxID=6455 RepID=UPI0039E7E034
MAAQSLTLNNGQKMPLVGIGSWQVNSADECKDTIRAALDAGYRHIDTAYAYQNEAFIGEVLQEYFKAGKLKREDIFITTKLWVTYHETDRVPLCIAESLKNLQLDYVDMYLIHVPASMRETGKGKLFPLDENNKPAFSEVQLVDTWKGMEQVAREGKAKSIGVSNFNMQQIEMICKTATIKPATNQVECHLYLQQTKLFKFLKERGITLTAYSPFGSPARPAHLQVEGAPKVLEDPVAKDLAAKYKRSVGQIHLRYLVQRGIIVIPKSSNPERIRENLQVLDFKLSDSDMSKLASQDRKLRFFTALEFKGHPSYPFDEPL